uniref:N-acetylgalactosaminide beta-1,3-galactosyltransferase n=1 Tax=Aceria tosichella TaxID=561515 RepID=A0A6G1SNE3_9ACAR
MRSQKVHMLVGLFGLVVCGQIVASRFEPTNNKPAAIKILCFVLSTNTTASNKKTLAIEKTWGNRCDKLLLIKNGTKTEEVYNKLIVAVDHDGRDQLWHKISKACEFIYEKYLNQYDWFFRADDDTYLLVDALRKFLTTKSSPGEPIHFGHRFKPFVRSGFMSGGSGIVLSREALLRMIELGFRRELSACELKRGQVDDVIMSKCLEAVGVKAGDTRDPHGKETFLPLSPMTLLNDKLDRNHWYLTYAYYEESDRVTGNKECCSRTPIAFHYIKPREMYLIDWLLNDVKRA